MNGHTGHTAPHAQNPIDQPAFVAQRPAAYTPIIPGCGIPQPGHYVSSLDPGFIQHLSRHQGRQIAIMTTAGRLEGKLAAVAVDHAQLNLPDRSLHVRISQIIYFEGPLASYR